MTSPTRGAHHNGHRRESQDLLAQSRGTQKAQKEVSQVMGLMHENVEALMIRDNNLESLSRRGSYLEHNSPAWNQRTRKPKRYVGSKNSWP